MPRRIVLLVSAVALGLLAGCEFDDSAPSRPRTGNFLTPSNSAQENAERRSLEPPRRQLPTSGAELPGQSALPPPTSGIVTLDASPGDEIPHPSFPGFPISGFYGPSGWNALGHTTGPVNTHIRDTYPGLLPHLPPNPGSIPMKEATIIPGSDWAVDWSWGQGLARTEAPHRNWPQITATYNVADANHAPTYYFSLRQHLPIRQHDGSGLSDACGAAIEDLWFYLNTTALPVLMLLEPPCAKRSTHTCSHDPAFTGTLPAGGPVVPAPYNGSLKWSYPFLNPDGTVKQSAGAASRPVPSTSPGR